MNGSKGAFGQTNYSAAKAGMHGFAKSLALEVAAAAKGIGTPAGALAALPSFISDPRKANDRTPWPTFTGPEIADLIAYLRSVSTK